MGISTDRTLRQQFIFFTIIFMLTGLFVSRALLSISMVLFLAFCFVHKDFSIQLRAFIRHPLLVGISLLFFIPLLTWFWSEDKETWWRFVRIKLPLFFFPLAFAGPWQLSTKQWKWVAWFFLWLVFAGCCWSLWQYAPNMKAIHDAYLKAKVIPTPFENDHVRFSLVVCMALLCSLYLIVKNAGRIARTVLIFLSVFFAVFLHILSARTGLLSLYLILFLGAAYLILTSAKVKWIMLFGILAIVMPVASWFLAPTFQNRIRYFIYDLSYIRQETYLPGANDGNRMLSIKAGWDILNRHPFGTGSGDVMKATHAWYDEHIHGMLDSDKIYPSSEWLMYGAAAGWPGLILFTVVMCIPFLYMPRSGRFFWISLNAITAFSFIFDIGLEVQFGIFIYVFMVLWWWKWFNASEENPLP